MVRPLLMLNQRERSMEFHFQIPVRRYDQPQMPQNGGNGDLDAGGCGMSPAQVDFGGCHHDQHRAPQEWPGSSAETLGSGHHGEIDLVELVVDPGTKQAPGCQQASRHHRRPSQKEASDHGFDASAGFGLRPPAILEEMTDDELVRRLLAKDQTIWAPPGTPEIANRLGWIDLPARMRPRVGELQELADDVLSEQPEDVVLLGMGGSSLAPEVMASVFGSRSGYPRLTVVDATHPEQVSQVRDSIDPAATVFLVCSKSGTTLETLSAFRYFWRETNGDGRRFIAITDPGTPLEGLARERGFRAVVNAPDDVGGRFSALTPFGLLPAALLGVDLGILLASATGVDWEDSVRMGQEWGERARAGIDKMVINTSRTFRAYPDWVEQLVAESLGKQGKGIVPVAGEPLLDRYSQDRFFLDVRMEGEPVVAPPAGHPVIIRDLSDRYSLGAEMMAAEIAAAVAGMVLGVNPFDQPDVELAKERARQAMDREPARVDLLEIHSPVLADRLDDFLADLGEGDYLAVQAYLPREKETEDFVAQLRHKVGNRAGYATTAGYGPRFLHSTGQLHKGGPNTGVFLQVVDQPTEDVEVPETETTFGQIIAAQALGDYLALRERERRILRIDLGPNRRTGMKALLEAIG